MMNLAANPNLINPFRSVTRNNFMDLGGSVNGATPGPRMSFNDFGSNTDALLNSTMPRPPNSLQGPGINELLQN